MNPHVSPMLVKVAPDGDVEWRGDACGAVHALELFKRNAGIVGRLERDDAHGVVLVGDRVVYFAEAAA